MMSSPTVETHEFQAEVSQILNLVVNSLYTNKEIFLRELISNASDAIDRLKFQALTDHDLLDDDQVLEITLIPDKEQHTLAIRDNGLGMTREEMMQNLGTIAHSGTQAFAKAMEQAQGDDASFIGQFGVGFYSSYLVADQVRVTSRAVGSDEVWVWQSSGEGGFTISEGEGAERGTEVLLTLKEDQYDYLEEQQLRGLVRTYSDYVSHPIKLKIEREADTEHSSPFEQVNTASALWTRKKADIEEDQYVEFYKHLTHDWEKPLRWTHFQMEGTLLYTGMLFVPARAPFDLFDPDAKGRGVRLFVKRVFVMDECRELVPDYLRFVRGIIDSDDLSLNVSREMLQKDQVVSMMRKQVIKQTLGLLDEMAAEDAEGYTTFWGEFGRVIKEGVYQDGDNKDRIAALLRFESSTADGLTSLADYIGRMKEDQPGIYYISGESRAAVANSPHIEALKQREYEVLYLVDPIDEWVVQALPEFDEKKLINAMQGEISLDETDEAKQRREKLSENMGPVFKHIKEALGEHVKEVRLSERLTDSPACLVADDMAMTANLERLLKHTHADMPIQPRILELNGGHPLIKNLEALIEKQQTAVKIALPDGGEVGGEALTAQIGNWIELLYDQALLTEGSEVRDMAAYNRRITELLVADTGRLA